MKKIDLFALVLCCSILGLSSCKKQKPESNQDFLRPATMEYSKKDTSDINYLVNRYAELVKNKDFSNAAEMLYKVSNDSVLPLSKQEKEGFVKAYSQMPIYAAKLNSFTLRSDKNNQVDVLIQIVKDGNIDEGIGVSKMSLNPVVKNGKWYLTLLDKQAEGVEDVYNPYSNSH